MEFRQLNTFIQVAKFQSFSKAAEHLGYSQSAVTVQIRMLEKELNTRLFDRMGKKILLTSQGQEFLECANTILYDVEKAKCSMESETGRAEEFFADRNYRIPLFFQASFHYSLFP